MTLHSDASMTIQHLDEFTLLALASGHFDAETREQYMRHVSACESCGRMYANNAEVWAALVLEEKVKPPSPEAKERLFRQIRASAQPSALDWSLELTKRLRVLLHAEPILDLRRWDMLREDISTQHYDSVALAMRVLDRIVESTGLGADVDENTVIRSLEPLLHRLDNLVDARPKATDQRQYLERLLGRLRNDADARRPFKLEYTDLNDSPPKKRFFEIRLIEEHFASDERTVLRLSKEAANLFLGALNLEIEDEQAAIEAVVQSQLDRGRFDEAVQAARDAKFRSQQLQEKIERLLRETRRDISSVDWLKAVPQDLREAREHITGRLRIERQIISSARERLEHLEQGSREAQRVALIADLMDDCFDRHLRLHEVLMTAHSVFFREQERQAFIPRRLMHLPDLFAGVLEPLMMATKADAIKALSEAMPTLLGVNAPSMLSLADLITGLLRPRRIEFSLSVPTHKQNWQEASLDRVRFSETTQLAAQDYLQQVPALLSTLIDRAGQAGEPEAVLEYLGLRTLQAFETDQTTGLQVRRVEQSWQAWGFFGDDLELELFSDAVNVDMMEEAQ